MQCYTTCFDAILFAFLLYPQIILGRKTEESQGARVERLGVTEC